MAQEEQISGTNKSSRKKMSNNQKEDNKPPKALYRVKTTGFTEQYTEYTVAKRNFDALKRKAVKEEKSFSIYLHVKDGSEWKEMEKAQITKSFYEN
jgi:hypothetical protein